MKCTVDTKELRQVVKLISPVVNINNPIISLRYLKIRRIEDKLEIMGYNTNIFVSIFINVYNLKGDDCVYVFAKTFFNLARSFNGTVELNLTPIMCQIKSNKSKYKVGVLDKDFFQGEVTEEPNHYTLKFEHEGIKLNDFKVNMKSIIHCLSSSDTQLPLQYVYFQDNIAIACDSIRGAIIGANYKCLQGCLLHQDIINCILNIDEASLAYFQMGIGKLEGKIGNFVFTLSIADVKYPYEEIKKIYDFYKSRIFNITIPIKQLIILEALSRLLFLTDKITNAIDTTFYPNYISFKVEGDSSGEEIVHIGDIGIKEPISLHIDAKNLRDALSHSIGEIYWKTDGSEDIQYIVDSDVVQFFFGLN